MHACMLQVEGTVFEAEAYGPFAVVVYREDHPGPITPDEIRVGCGG